MAYSFFFFYERKKNKCEHVLHCDIIAIKEHCCWLIFFKIQILKLLSLFFFCIQSINRQPLAAKKWHRFPNMQHRDCISFLADMQNPFNNTAMENPPRLHLNFLNYLHFLFPFLLSAAFWNMKLMQEISLEYIFFDTRISILI